MPKKLNFFISICLVLLTSATAQFTCSMSGSSDKHSCVKSTDGGDHCVWCGFGGSGYGLCVSESQAEALEKNFPIANCDRYSGSDDDVNPNPPPDNDR